MAMMAMSPAARTSRDLRVGVGALMWVAVSALSVGAARSSDDVLAWIIAAMAALALGGAALGMAGRFLDPAESAWANAEASLSYACMTGAVPLALWFMAGASGLGLAIDLTLVFAAAALVASASALGALRTGRGRHRY